MYRCNFIDKNYCKQCVGASFIVGTSVNGIMQSENLVAKSTINKEVKSLYKCFGQSKGRSIAKTLIDNKFLILFDFPDGKKMIYSHYHKEKWLLNDSIIIVPNENVFKVIRKLEALDDLTDYRHVSRSPIPVSMDL